MPLTPLAGELRPPAARSGRVRLGRRRADGPGDRRAHRAARRGQGHRVRHERRAPQRRGAGAQALATGVPGLARGGRDGRRGDAVPPRRALRPRPGGGRRDRLAVALHRHVEQAGLRIVNDTAFASRAEVVVVGAHDGFDYAELREAAQAALRGRHAGRRRARRPSSPCPTGPGPGTGAVVAAIETAAGRRRGERRQAVARRSCTPRSTGSGQGARCSSATASTTDLGGRANAGIDGALVLTGATTAAAARTGPRARRRAREPGRPRTRI